MQQKQNIHKNTVINSNITTELLELTNTEREYIENEKRKHYYEDMRAISIEALKIIQKNRGWVPDLAIKDIAQLLNIPSSDVEGVATFYSQIFRRPVGRNIIRYCDSMVCYINGYQDIKIELERLLDINPGQTTTDNCFTLLPTCCLGNCDKGPTMMVNDKTHIYLKPEDIALILEQYK